MKNLQFGLSRYEEFEINGDPDRVIRFDPADPGIVSRLNDAKAKLEAMKFSEDAVDSLVQADKAVRDQIDFIFDAPVSDIAFGAANVLTPIDSRGTLLFEAFLNAVVPEITSAIERRQGAANARVKEYLDRYSSTDKEE